MGRPKKQIKAKEPVRLRTKALRNGNKSLYLDIYSGGVRKYEYLKLYLVPEVSDAAKSANRNTLQVAEQIKAERIIALQNRGIGQWEEIKASSMPLVQWLKLREADDQPVKAGALKARKDCRRKVEEFLDYIHKPNIGLDEIDKNFCEAFLSYLRNAPSMCIKKKSARNISQGTQFNYMRGLMAAFNRAVKDGLMERNPFSELPHEDLIKSKEGNREFLTIEEVKKLIETDCLRDDVRVAFLFSCCTGLRISDIRTLKPSDIKRSADGSTLYINKEMQKTGNFVVVPLSKEALRWLPKEPNAEGFYFSLPSKSTINRTLGLWAKAAGIDKITTFHVGRHTFATSMLTLGADIYTTSKLLGHKDVRTTEVYAKVVDSKKIASVNLLDNMFNQLSASKQ